jgi:nucleoside-diphosphate-sugar epimerase
VGYLSSTSVYGEHGGEWVDEDSALHLPDGDGDSLTSKARARAQAETGWLELHRAHGVPVHIFRLGGIYGRGRSLLDGVRRRAPPGTTDTTRARGGKRYISRCHVTDIVAVLRASMAQPNPGYVYKVLRALAPIHA